MNDQHEQTKRHDTTYTFLAVTVVCIAASAMVRFSCDAEARKSEAFEESVRTCIAMGGDPRECRAGR